MNQLLKKKQNQLKAKKGFTLVELIIVIAIIAILAAVAIPKFGAIRKDANLASDQANAKIIATAVATAVSNGDAEVYGKNSVVDTSKITTYIDGGQLPKPKTSGAEGFKVLYTEGNGITVFLNASADGTGSDVKIDENNTNGQVYPVK